MRYWIWQDERIGGPMTVEQLARLPDFSGETPVLPEDAPLVDPCGWRAAAEFPDFRSLPGKGEEAAPPSLREWVGGWKGLAALAAGAVALGSALFRP